LLKFFLSLLLVGLSPTINAWIDINTDQNVWVLATPTGNYQALVSQLTVADLVDESLNWSGHQAVLVITGDILTSDDQSIQSLDFIIKLEAQAKSAGGNVITMLGKQDVRRLMGKFASETKADLEDFTDRESLELRAQYFNRYVNYMNLQRSLHDSAQDNLGTPDASLAQGEPSQEDLQLLFEQSYPKGYFARLEAFSPNGNYGKWLLGKPFLVRINDKLISHAGLSPQLSYRSIDELNQTLKHSLVNYIDYRHQLITDGLMLANTEINKRADGEPVAASSALQKLEEIYPTILFDQQSPLIYQGELYCHSYYQEEMLERMLKRFGAQQLIIGQGGNHLSKIATRHNEKVYLLNSANLAEQNSNQGSHLLKITEQTIIGIDERGNSYKPGQRNPNAIAYPKNISHDELLSILKTAPIEKMEPLSTGITKPYRLTFKDTPTPIRALFKTIDTFPGIEKRKTKSSEEKYADRYHFDIAAYRLSEHMGFHLVPALVEREINGVKGIVQFWVEDSQSYLEAEDQGIKYQGVCDLKAQRNMLRIFDLLIFNHDRNKSNMLFEPFNKQLLWIDHSRSLSAHKRLPGYINITNIKISPQVRNALKALNKESLNTLMNGLLNKDQINAILYRRKMILKLDPEDH